MNSEASGIWVSLCREVRLRPQYRGRFPTEVGNLMDPVFDLLGEGQVLDSFPIRVTDVGKIGPTCLSS